VAVYSPPEVRNNDEKKGDFWGLWLWKDNTK
jgi:hypothetical protein